MSQGVILAPAIRELVDQVRDAADARTPLRIRGQDTKAFYGRPCEGKPLQTAPLAGVASYEPSELVVTARAGTSLPELEAELAQKRQCLAFEPPRFAGAGTVGGMVAAGLSGPARASAGAVRDHVLGVVLLNGRGEVLHFGGQVIKNVAGYDVPRLIAGSLGTLGVVLEASLRVTPLAAASATLCFDLDEAAAVTSVNQWMGHALPVHASAWHDGVLTLRLQGAEAAVRSACARLGGERLDEDAGRDFWDAVRDQRHLFFAAPAAGRQLWRLSIPATASPLALEPTDAQFIEWHGALRWVVSHAPARHMFNLAARAGGHATLWRSADANWQSFAELAEPQARIHRALKQAFDPAGIFNPGRMYAA